MNSDHADEIILAKADPLGQIFAMAVDPANSQVLYVAAGGRDNPSLFVSRDYGQNWQKQAEFTSAIRHMWIDPQSSPEERTIFVGGTKFLAVVKGSNVHDLALPGDVTDISLGFGSSLQPTIYATSEKGVLVSADGGGTWHTVQFPGSGAKVRAIATSLHHPETAYVSYSDLLLDGREWLGVAKTSNAGTGWQLVWKESSEAAKNVHDDWITERMGVTWGENPLNITVADQDPNLSYATDLGRTMRTMDGGATWSGMYSRKVNDSGWRTVGLDVTTSYGVHFDPFDPKRVFITYTDIGLFRSEDGGTSWTRSVTGVPEHWTNTTYWIVFDPKVKGRMWSVNSGTHDLPRPKMWRHTSPMKFRGGVCRSDDGGKTWTKSNDGMEETAATHILLDPTSPV